jgi:asparagine synthase (glutamine-hydrolysing)
MCGIVGLVGLNDTALLKRMNEISAHRGPDDSGEFYDPESQVSLAMRRLSIIDPEGGHQPMTNEDETVWIVFNGEIFNAPSLRQELISKGHRFMTSHSDTEVLVHLYEEYEVIFDRKRQILFGVRDRFGIKPLYYFQKNGTFGFSSELKSILTLPFIEKRINIQSFYHYMTLLYVPGQSSIVEGVERLPSAHYFIYSLVSRALMVRRYWTIPFNTTNGYSEEEWAEVVRSELENAVKRWSLSDVPIGCSLSGGLDSSALVALLALNGQEKIRTYSLGFRGRGEVGWDETGLAKEVANKWGTEHHEIFLEPKALLNDIMKMVWYLDEPYAGGLPAWYVFNKMSDDVKVGLTGLGGDELFGNYGKFCRYEGKPLVAFSFRLRHFGGNNLTNVLSDLIKPFSYAAQWLPESWRWVGRNRALSSLSSILRAPFGRDRYASFLSDEEKDMMLHISDGRLKKTSAYLQDIYDDIESLDLRNCLAAVDMNTQLTDEFLFMTDRLSMSHGLEARVPYLDHFLVEKVFQMPSSIRTRGNDPKYLIKKAVADLLPPALLSAPKRGFIIPIELWLRVDLRPLVERLLSPEYLRKQGLICPDFYYLYVLPHLEGHANNTWSIWAALMFQLWHIIYIEQSYQECPDLRWHDLL